MADTKIITQTAAPSTEPTTEEVQAFKRRLIETADRSYLNDRFNVPLPEHLYGQWVGTDDFSQFQAQQQGYVDGQEYLTKFNKIHEQADGKSTIGDVKFMVIPKWKHEAYEERNQIIAARKSGLNADEVSKMESSYAKSIGLDTLPDSTTARRIDGDELNALLKR
jgi:hypothetical protein